MNELSKPMDLIIGVFLPPLISYVYFTQYTCTKLILRGMSTSVGVELIGGCICKTSRKKTSLCKVNPPMACKRTQVYGCLGNERS